MKAGDGTLWRVSFTVPDGTAPAFADALIPFGAAISCFETGGKGARRLTAIPGGRLPGPAQAGGDAAGAGARRGRADAAGSAGSALGQAGDRFLTGIGSREHGRGGPDRAEGRPKGTPARVAPTPPAARRASLCDPP